MLKTLAARLPASLRDELYHYNDRIKIAAGKFQPVDPELPLVAQHVKPGDTVLDVGANVGNWTLWLSRLVGSSGRVHAFEPILSTVARLSSNAKHLDNVTVWNFAVGARAEMLSMDIPRFATGLANHAEAEIKAGGAYRVLCRPLDSLQLESCAFIKIDCENHNFPVLAGASLLIERFRPLLVIEWGKDGDWKRCEEWLRARGYTITQLKKSSNFVATG